MEIYKKKELKKPNIIQKWFGRVPKKNAIIEINNLLASVQDINQLDTESIFSVAEKYNVNLSRRFRKERYELFMPFLQNCLADYKLDDAEISSLGHLKQLLFLSEKDTKDLIEKESKGIYEKNVTEAVKDGRLTETEKKNLERIKKDLLLPEEFTKKIYEEKADEILQNFVHEAISDGKISPDEEREMNAIAKSLGINLEFDEKSKELFERYKLYWQIENGELPELIPDIRIQKSEKLHFKTYVNWLEQRKVTRRINYAGPTARIRIAKGIYYRMGSMNVQPVSEDVWRTIDSGMIYLTNKRLIFMGSKGNKTIRLNRILDIKPYTNGVDIQKDAGRSPFLEFNNNVDLFSMILVRLLDEI